MMLGNIGLRSFSGGPLAEGSFVRLIYIDEAGTSSKEPVCVVASVIVHGDSQWRILEAEMRRLIAERVPRDLQQGFVLHATEVFSGGKKIPRDKWHFHDRVEFLKEVLRLPISNDVPIAVGVEFKRDWSSILEENPIKSPQGGRKIDSNQFSHFMAFASCMERSDLFLRKYLKNAEVVVAISEDIPEFRQIMSGAGLVHRLASEKITVPSHMLKPEKWQEELGEYPDDVTFTIENIIDVPHFVKKGVAPILQIADACAFAFRRCLIRREHGDELVMAMLGPAQGESFISDPVWFSDASSGLFNTQAYWSAEHRALIEEKLRKLQLAKKAK